jgi:hypothetical protein
MITHKQEKWMMMIIVTGFSAQLFCMTLAMTLFTPDYSKEFPVYAPESNVFLQLGLALLIAASTMMGIRLAETEKIPAAGFTMLAISSGVMMAALFETTTVFTLESYEKQYYIITSSNFLYAPAMLMISQYREFKPWLRRMGIISTLPLLTVSFMFLFHYRNFTRLELIGTSGYSLIMITQLIWALNVYSNYRKKII